MTHEEYLAHDAVGMADRVRRGEVRAGELLERARERIRLLDPELNAVVRVMEAHARASAEAVDAGTALPGGRTDAPGALRPTSGKGRDGGEVLLAGVPFLAKDLLTDYAGHPTSAGSRFLADTPARRDSELARRVKAAGLLVLGKTNLPEWGLVPTTEGAYWGACRNPWDPRRTPGGSSGGSAAAVAAGIVPVAGGGDGGGSIRIPASCCGLFGLKPTRGRTPTGPDRGLLWRGAVVEHVLTRSVRDSATLLDATRGPDPGAPAVAPSPARPYRDEVGRPPGRLRIGFTREPFLAGSVHPDCVTAVEDAARLLEELGHEVVEARPTVRGDELRPAFLTVVAAELAADLEDAGRLVGRSARRSELESSTWALALLGRGIPAARYASAIRTLERTGRDTAPFFQEHDLLLTPTVAAPPPRLGALGPSRAEERLLGALGALGSGRLLRWAGLLDQAADGAFDFTPWTPVANATGRPAMSVPLWWNDEGLPVGSHLVARYGREDVLFRVAAQLEEARPWFRRLPEMARGVTTG